MPWSQQKEHTRVKHVSEISGTFREKAEKLQILKQRDLNFVKSSGWYIFSSIEWITIRGRYESKAGIVLLQTLT